MYGGFSIARHKVLAPLTTTPAEFRPSYASKPYHLQMPAFGLHARSFRTPLRVGNTSLPLVTAVVQPPQRPRRRAAVRSRSPSGHRRNRSAQDRVRHKPPLIRRERVAAPSLQQPLTADPLAATHDCKWLRLWAMRPMVRKQGSCEV